MSGIKYRPDIDGLRAIAVSAVILEHAQFEFISGGYIGVDVFFVISGYLITTYILSGMEEGKFSFLDFYLRRLRRLLPALFLVLVVTVPFSWLMLLPDEFSLYAKSLIGSTAYVANLIFWKSTDYFSPGIAEMPLIHIWSLAVEEQFYLFFPPAIYVAFRFARQKTVPLALIVTLASLVLADYGSRHYPVATFYLLPTRVWEFGVGTLCAIATMRGFVVRSSAGSLAGLAAISFAAISFDETTRHPSYLTLLPVLGAGLIILSHGPRNLGSRLLSLPLLVFIGLVSYSLYLWHQPVFAFARIRIGTQGPLELTLLIPLVFALAVLTWHFVERPFRHNATLMRPRRFCGVALPVALALIAAGLVFLSGWTMQTRLPESVMSIFQDEGRTEMGANCHWQPGRPLDHILRTCVFGSGGDRILVVGDSHAGTLVTAFSEAIASWPGLSITEVHAAGCAPIRGLYRLDGNSQSCHVLTDELLSEETLLPYSTVVMVARWSLYYEGTGFDNGEGGVENTKFAPVDTHPYRISRFPMSDDSQRKARVGHRIRDEIQTLLDAGKTVVFVEAVPEVGWDVSRLAARHVLFNDVRLDTLSTPQEAYHARIRGYQNQIDAISHPRFVRVPTGTLFCDLATAPDRCIAIQDGNLLYSDTNHLNLFGARRLVGLVLRSHEQMKHGSGKATPS